MAKLFILIFRKNNLFKNAIEMRIQYLKDVYYQNDDSKFTLYKHTEQFIIN